MNSAADQNPDCQEGEQVVGLEKADTRRRTLLKGSAAVLPMIVTLRSGAALAASSADGCVQASQTQALQTPPSVKVGGDSYLRVPIKWTKLKKLRARSSGGGGGWEIDTDAVDIEVYQSQTPPDSLVWWGFVTSVGVQEKFTQTSTSPVEVRYPTGSERVSGYYVDGSSGLKYLLPETPAPASADGLVVTDSAGTPQTTEDGTTKQVGYVVFTTGGASAISESCWCSIS